VAAERVAAERVAAERVESERVESERLAAERLAAERLAAERLARSRLEAANRKVEAVSRKVVAARLAHEQTQQSVFTSELELSQARQVVNVANDDVRQVKQELDGLQEVVEIVQLAITQLKEKMATLTEEAAAVVNKINVQLALIKRLLPIQEELKKVVEESQDREVAEALSSLGQVLVGKNEQAVQYRDEYHAMNRNFETLGEKLATVENQAEGHQNTIESTLLELADAKQRFVDAQNLAEEKQEGLVSMQGQVEQSATVVESTLEELRLARLNAEQMTLEMEDLESSPAILPQFEPVDDVDEAI
jgi:chromosome segregation ATPase